MGHFSILPQTMHVTPKNKKLDLDILWHLEQLLGLGLGGHFSTHVKRPPKSSKNEMLILGLRSTSDYRPSDLSNESQPKCKKMTKGPLSHQKMKCSFLDYVQLLMISQVIWAMKVDQNAKKRPPMSSKNEMFIFGLFSTSDYLLSDPNNKRLPKCKKMIKDPLSHQKIKYSCLDNIQLLMIGWVIRVTNVDQNAKNFKKASLSHGKIKCLFLDYVQLLMIGWAIWATNVDQNTKKGKKAP